MKSSNAPPAVSSSSSDDDDHEVKTTSSTTTPQAGGGGQQQQRRPPPPARSGSNNNNNNNNPRPTFRDAMCRANPGGSVDNIVRYRPLASNETLSSVKVVAHPVHKSSSNSSNNTQQHLDVESISYTSFARAFLPAETTSDRQEDVGFILRNITSAQDRGCTSIAVVAGGPHQSGKSSFVASTLRSFVSGLFSSPSAANNNNTPTSKSFFSLAISAVQVFSNSTYDLLRVSLEHPKGFYVESAAGIRGRELRAGNESDALQILERATAARDNSLHHTKHIASRSTAIYSISYRKPSAVSTTRFLFVDLAGCDRDTPFLNEEVLKQQRDAAESLSALMRTISFWAQQRDGGTSASNPALTSPAVAETIARDAKNTLVQQLPFFEDPSLHITFATCVSPAAQHIGETRAALNLADELAFFTTSAASEHFAHQAEEVKQQQRRSAGRDGSPDAVPAAAPLLPHFDIWSTQQTRRSVSIAQDVLPTSATNSARGASQGVDPLGASVGGNSINNNNNNNNSVSSPAAMEQIEALRMQLRAIEAERDNLKRQIGSTPRNNNFSAGGADDTPTSLDDTVRRGQSYPSQLQQHQNRGVSSLSSSAALAAPPPKQTRDFQIQVVPTHVMTDEHGASLDRSIEFAIEDVYDQLMRIPSLGQRGRQSLSSASTLDLLQMQEAENRLQLKSQCFQEANAKMMQFMFGASSKVAEAQRQIAAASRPRSVGEAAVRESAAHYSESVATDTIVSSQFHSHHQHDHSSSAAGAAAAEEEGQTAPSLVATEPLPLGTSVPLDDFRRANSAAFMEAYRQRRLAGTGYVASANNNNNNNNTNMNNASNSTKSRSMSASGMMMMMVGGDELQAAMSQRDRALDREAEALKMASARTVQAERDVNEANASRREAEEKAQRLQKELADRINEYERRIEELTASREASDRAQARELREVADRAARLQELADEEKSKKESLTSRAAKYSTEAQDRMAQLEDDVARLQDERDVAVRQLETQTLDLKRHVARLEAELDIVSSDRDATRRLADAKAARTIAEKVEALQAQLDDANLQREAASSRASKISKDAAERISALEKQLEDAVAARDANEFDATRKGRDLSEQNEALLERLRAAEASRDTAVARYERLNADSVERIKSLEAQLDRTTETRERALDNISQSKRDSVDQAQQLSAELDTERAERLELAARLKKASRDNAEKTKALEEELAKTAEERDAALGSAVLKVSKALAERTRALQQDVEVATKQRDIALQRLAEQTKELTAKLHASDQELLETKSKLDLLQYSSAKEIREAQDRCARLNRELVEASAARDTAQDELQRASKESAGKIAKLEQARAEVVQGRESEAAAAAKTERELRTRVAALESEVSELERSVEDTEVRGAKKARDTAARLSEMQARLDEAEAEAEKLRSDAKKQSTENMNRFRKLDAELADAIAQRDQAAADLKRANDKAVEERTRAVAESSARSQSRSIDIDHEASSSANSSLVKQLTEARDSAIVERDAAQSKFERLQRASGSEIADLRSQLRAAETEQEKLTAKEQETAKKLREALAAYRNLEQEVDQAKIDAALQLRILETGKSSSDRRNQDDLEAARKRIAHLEALNKQQEEECRNAEEAVKMFNEQLEGAIEHAAKLEEERDALQKRVDEMTGRIDEMVAEHRQQADKARSEAVTERARAIDLSETLEKDKKSFEERRERELLDLTRESVGMRGEKAALEQSVQERDAEIATLREQLESAKKAADEAAQQLQDEKVSAAAKRSELVKTATAAQNRAANSRQVEFALEAKHLEQMSEAQKQSIAHESASELHESAYYHTNDALLDLDGRHAQLRAEYDNAMMLAEASAVQLRAHATKMEAERDDAVHKLDDFLKQYDAELSNAIQEATTRLQHAQKAQTAATTKAAEAMTKAQRMVEEAERDRQDVIVVARKQLSVSQHISDVMADEADGRRTITHAWMTDAGSIYSDWWHLVEAKLWEWLTEASTALGQADADYQTVSTERDNLRAQLRIETERADCAEDDRDRYLKQLRAAEMNVEQLQHDKDQLNATFTRSIKQLQDEHTGYEALSQAQRDRMQRADDEVAQLGKQLESARRTEVERENEIHQLRRNIKAANSELAKASSEVEALRSKLKSVDAARREAQARVQELTNALADLRDSNFRLSQRAESAAAEAQTEKSRGLKEAAQVQNLLAEIEELQRGYASARRELIVLAETVGLKLNEKSVATLPPGIIQIRAAVQKLLRHVADVESQARSQQMAQLSAAAAAASVPTPSSADGSASESSGTKAGVVKSRGIKDTARSNNNSSEKDAEIQRLLIIIEKLRAGEHGRVAELQRAVMLLRDQLEQQQDTDGTIARLRARIAELEHFISTTTTQKAEASPVSSPVKGSRSDPTSSASALRSELDDTRAQLNKAESERAALASRHRQELQSVEQELKVTRSELIEMTNTVTVLRDQLAQTRDAHLGSDDERTKRIAELEFEVEQLTERCAMLEAEHHQMTQSKLELIDQLVQNSSGSNFPTPNSAQNNNKSTGSVLGEASTRTEASPAARRPHGAGSSRDIVNELQGTEAKLKESLAERDRLLRELQEVKASRGHGSGSTSQINDLVMNLQKENYQLVKMNDDLTRQVQEMSEVALASSMGGLDRSSDTSSNDKEK